MEVNSKEVKVFPKNASSVTTFYKLSEEQVKFYHENGYLVIKELIEQSVLEMCRDRFLSICEGSPVTKPMVIIKEKKLISDSAKREEYINKVNEIQFDDVFMRYSEHPTLLQVVTQLIGAELMVINTMFINKPPGCSQHHPHQDLHYGPYRPADRIVGTWTAVDPATIDNGCLWVAPASHKANTLYKHWYLPGGLRLYHGILDSSVSEMRKRVYLEMSPGDTVFMHSLLVHGSGPNNTKNYRKSIATHYANSRCEMIEARGTQQEALAREMEQEAFKSGLDLDYKSIWRLKSKTLGQKSKL